MTEPGPEPAAPARAALVQRFVAERGHYLGFLRLLTGDAGAAEDLFQDLSVAVIEGLDRYDAGRDFPRWVRGIARNLARKRAARAGRAPAAGDEALAAAVAAAYDEAEEPAPEELSARREGLRRCLDALAGRQRSLVEARYREGRSSAEIGAALGMRPGAVDTALCRLRAALLDCVRRRLGGAT